MTFVNVDLLSFLHFIIMALLLLRNPFFMYGVIFTRQSNHFSFTIEGFLREGIRLEVVNPTSNLRENDVIYTSSVFLFQGVLSPVDINIIKLIRLLKPTSCIVLLDPEETNDSEYVDLMVTRPFSYPYLSVMIQKHICERREERKGDTLKMGLMTLHIYTRILATGSHEIILRNKEFELVRYFFLNPGRIVTRSDLLESVWDRSSTISTNTIDVHISRLRRKLKECHVEELLRTVPCLGYQWLVGVTS